MRSEILKRFVFKDKKEDILHSSGYAKAQNRVGMGASSTESFEERRKIDLNRKIVKGYNDSKMINDMGRQTARLRMGIKKDLEKREKRFGAKEESKRFGVGSRTSAGEVGSGSSSAVKRATMPRKNPGIFR